MKPLTCVLTLLLTIVFAVPESAAVILYGKDNDANQTGPGDGSPWDFVARMTNSTGLAVTTGSAVYLGHRYMLTANHVDPDEARTHVTFDGNELFAIEPGSYQQVAPNVDLKVFRLSDDPGLGEMMLYEDFIASDDLSRGTVQVGWGVGRDPTVVPGTNTVPWGTSATVAKRWGTNATLAASTVVTYTASGESYTYEALQTQLQTNGGADEAAMTLYDSGGALFQLIGGDWHLSGIATSVEGAGNSVFGNVVTGDLNYFARISSYSDEINAIIPEPSAWAAMVGLGAIGLAVGARRRRKSGEAGTLES